MMLGTKQPKRSVHKVVEYIQGLKMAREKVFARRVYRAAMKDEPEPGLPMYMGSRRATEIRAEVLARIPERVDPPRDDFMCMYPSRCDGFCLKQQEDGWACNS